MRVDSDLQNAVTAGEKKRMKGDCLADGDRCKRCVSTSVVSETGPHSVALRVNSSRCIAGCITQVLCTNAYTQCTN